MVLPVSLRLASSTKTTKLTSSIIAGFVKAFLINRYDNSTGEIPWFHYEMWDFCCSDARRVAIAAPRGHAKSTAITFAYVLANLCMKLKHHVMIISSTEKIASELLNELKQEFLENEMLTQIFKFKKLLKDSETEIIGLFEDGSKFRVIAKGAEQKMRGTKWERKRPDLVIGDDMEDDEIVLNQERRIKFREWFYGAVRPIISENGEIRLVGTLLSLDSLLANLMPEETNEATIVEPLKTYTLKPYKGWYSIVYRAHTPDFRNILWPAMGDAQDWRDKLEEYTRQGLLEKYNQEFLNNPVDNSTAYFKEEYFRTSPGDSEWLRRPKRRYAAADLAVSTSQRADWSVIVVASLDSEGHLEVEHARRGHWDSNESIKNLLEVQKYFEPEIFALEKGVIEKAIGPFLQAEQRKQQVYLNLETIAPTADKRARARSIQGRMKNGDVFFPKDTDWFPEFYDELRKFDRGKHDDYVDAFAYIGLLLDHMVSPPTAEEELEWEKEQERSMYMNMNGANQTTGY